VFGISDGLTTNVSLILGIAGANPTSGFVRLAGLAGLVAGSFSMAAGEYLSMKAQTELFEAELDLERREIDRRPESERRELAAIYRSRGVDRDTAEKLATESTPLDDNDRWWVWKCPTKGDPGLLHVAGYSREKHALVVVCDGTCGKTYLR